MTPYDSSYDVGSASVCSGPIRLQIAGVDPARITAQAATGAVQWCCGGLVTSPEFLYRLVASVAGLLGNPAPVHAYKHGKVGMSHLLRDPHRVLASG